MWNSVTQLAFSDIVFLSQSKQLLRCSLVFYTQPHSGTISPTIGMHLHLQSFYVYVSSYAPGKTVRVCRLVWAFAGRMFERYHNLMNWLVSLTTMLKHAKIYLHLGLCVFAYVWWSIVFNLLVGARLVNLENRKDTWALGRKSPCRTHAGIRSGIAKFYIFVIFRVGGPLSPVWIRTWDQPMYTLIEI